MLRVITSANRHLHDDFMEQHYELRHRIYVRERGWKALDRPDGREIDQFDTDDAIYLLAVNDDQVIGGSRLVPTEKPHLMSDVFPQLADVKGLQRAPDIYEWTRYFVANDKREIGRACDVSGKLAAGIMELCLALRIRRLTVVMETYWLTRFLEYGWKIEPLGLPQLIDNRWTIGVAIDIAPAAHAGVCLARGITGTVLEIQDLINSAMRIQETADHGTAPQRII